MTTRQSVSSGHNTGRRHASFGYLSRRACEDLPNPWAAARQPIPVLNHDCP
jgi:hypothetical protein